MRQVFSPVVIQSCGFRMDSGNLTSIIAPLVTATLGVLGGVFGYRQAIRTTSGTVDTSDSRQLWEQQKEVFARLEIIAERYETENQRLSVQVIALQEENRLLRAQVEHLTKKVERLEQMKGHIE